MEPLPKIISLNKISAMNNKFDHDNHPQFQSIVMQLQEYFDGARSVFDLPLQMNGTAFQKKVWEAICDIPLGETRTYGQIAKAIGKPAAARAVGTALNKNPIAIIVPCHRIVGSNGALTGYAGGLKNKKWLLEHEKKFPVNKLQVSS